MENKNKQIINLLQEVPTGQKILAWIVADNKFIRIFKIGKGNFWGLSKSDYCFFCTDEVRKKQGNFCDRYCQGFYESREAHRKLRMDSWRMKEEKEYNFVEGNLVSRVVKRINLSYADFQAGKRPLHEIYTRKEWEEKPSNEQRLRIIRKIHAYLAKKREEFLYCFASNCFKPFEITPQTFSPFFCSKKCVRKQQGMMKSREWREEQERTEKWYKEHQIKIKEIEETNLLYEYGIPKEELPSFRKLFGGEITEKKLEDFFKLVAKMKNCNN